MISKNKKRKILIPKAANLRKCSVHLGQIDSLLSRINSTKRKSYGKSFRIGTPAASGTKLIRVKSDLFKKTSTPLNNSERVSKRTPKPNRRYVNDETIISSSWNEKEITSEEVEESEEDRKSPPAEPIRKNRVKIGPKSVINAAKEKDRLAASKRKILYDEKPGPKQHKKVSIKLLQNGV